MSRELISRSPDLKRLQDEGYQIDVVDGHLILRHVPYVTRQRQVHYGILVSSLKLAGERTTRPDTHVAFFAGEQPCDKDGREIAGIKHTQQKRMLAQGITVDRAFSNKPKGGYPDYFEKMTNYVNILSGPAQALDPNATARTFVVETTDASSVFVYTDTATARAEIGAVSARLKGQKIGIIGLGGTGSYILDLVAKTPVEEIHIFDADRFFQHNAFRAPGAASLDQLRAIPSKVEHLRDTYSRMHKGIVAHPVRVDCETASLVDGLDFVFLCVDSGSSRRSVIDVLHERNLRFIDVGMGIDLIEENRELVGQLRVSTSTPAFRGAESRIPLEDGATDDDYDSNIQIADMNCLNAALAVIRWKKLCGFYQDREHEHFSSYALNVNQLVSEEPGEEAQD